MTGISTTSISLVREHTEKLKPPRALWVPFPFGHAFGRPNDPEIQHRVLRAALDLLDEPSGPVLRELPSAEAVSRRRRDHPLVLGRDGHGSALQARPQAAGCLGRPSLEGRRLRRGPVDRGYSADVATVSAGRAPVKRQARRYRWT